MKYFNFLLENDINFKRDETGNFTALVKVFNPEYFKDKEKSNNKETKKSNFENENTKIDYKSSHRSSSARMKIANTKEEQKPKLEKEISQRRVNIISFNSQVSHTNINEVISMNYPRFYTKLNPLLGIRGKKLNFYNLKHFIEEIYSIRFIKDTNSLKSQLSRNKMRTMKLARSYGNYVLATWCIMRRVT